MDETPQHSELEYRLRQQALLAALGQRALAVNDISALLDEAVRLAAIGLGAPYCKILEFEPENGRLRMRAGVGWPAELVGNVTVGADLDSPAG